MPSALRKRRLARRPAARRDDDLVRREPAARARVGRAALAVRRDRRSADVGARTEARIHQPRRLERRERALVQRASLRLPDRVAVPVDAERREVLELALDDQRPGAVGVEILDAQQEAPSLTTRPQPREQRSARVAHVQRPARARRVASDVRHRRNATVRPRGARLLDRWGTRAQVSALRQCAAGRALQLPLGGPPRRRRHPARAPRDGRPARQDRDHHLGLRGQRRRAAQARGRAQEALRHRRFGDRRSDRGAGRPSRACRRRTSAPPVIR